MPMLRKLLIIVVLALCAALAYAAAPLHAAWRIREAVRADDTATLRQTVDWHEVRQSLKASVGETRKVLGELAEAAGLPPPTLWQRIKAAALPYLADPLIDRYVTAEGAPKLYAWRQTLRKGARAVQVAPAQASALAGTWLAGSAIDRGWSVARRIERLAFTSPTRLEIEISDRYAPGRRWLAALELRGLGWQLTQLRVLPGPPARRPAAKARLVGRDGGGQPRASI